MKNHSNKLTPTDCINNNCSNIVYLPYFQIHNRVMCKNCVEKSKLTK